MEFDIIGDIHGHSSALQAFLTHLGYQDRNGAWRHPSRQALFVGDFIDRGPGQLETVEIVRKMVDAGTARAVMGNHEFNAIAWHTPDPLAPGEYLRPHSGDIGRKNHHQHQHFLAEVSDKRIHAETIDWFLTLPLWLDLPALRVVHACWNEEAMAALEPLLTPERQLTRELMVHASRPGRIEFRSAECLTKGIEVPLPDGHTFFDKDGHERGSVRIRWWENNAHSYRALALMPERDLHRIPDVALPAGTVCGYTGPKPVFFGHYWMQGTPAPVSPAAACVDYSVAKGGKLVAYRFSAGEPLSAQNFAWAGH